VLGALTPHQIHGVLDPLVEHREAVTHAVDLVPTFLGAHEIPPEFRERRADYVSLVINEMIPRVAAEGLAEWCDVFCETGVFTPDESLAILEAGRRAGLEARVHADELGPSGGSRVAATIGARSADHLLFTDAAAARGLAAAGVCAVLLPTAAFYLKLGRFAPARMLIDRGVTVALGVSVAPLTPDAVSRLRLPKNARGVVVEEVDPDGRAADAGIQPGDLIEEVNGQPVNTVDDLRAAVSKTTARPLLLLVNRQGSEIFVTLRPSNG